MSIGILAVAIICFISVPVIFYFVWDSEKFPKIFLAFTGIVLAGYALFGRGFAYIGYPPAYIGEVLTFFGILTVVFSSLWMLLFRSKVLLCVLGLLFWGVICTVPYIGTYGMDSLRDAVLFGYALFAIMIFVCLIKYPYIDEGLTYYRKFIPFALVILLVAGIIRQVAYNYIPTHPGTDIAIIHLKSGDAAVHLSGIAIFFLLGLHKFTVKSGRNAVPSLVIVICASLWAASFILFASGSRGGLLSIACAMLVALPFIPIRKGMRVGLAIVILFLGVTIVNVNVEIGSERRSISTEQIVRNFTSIFVSDPGDTSGLSGTREWRLLWWGAIIDYTVYGEHFWTGKGYGVNLGVDDGFRSEEDGTRSPHNGHLTVLARSGVPGLAIWIVVQVSFAVAMLRGILRARAPGNRKWLLLNAWVLAYWTAFIVNGAFDVFLEGPQGGIWFWSLIGVGLAALEIQKREHKASIRARLAREVREPSRVNPSPELAYLRLT